MGEFSQTELKHLKFKMINERGMTPSEADKEIKSLIDWCEKKTKIVVTIKE